MAYTGVISKNITPQDEPIPGENQVQNNAGGFVYAITPWQRLERFLILGSASNTYYQDKKKLTKENAHGVLECIKQDGPRVVATIRVISEANRAPKVDPSLFALAMCEAFGDLDTRHAVETVFNKIVRTGTHLFQFMTYLTDLDGHLNKQNTSTPHVTRQQKRLLSRWYSLKPADALAYQVVKYQSRAVENERPWSHRDILRLAHTEPGGLSHQVLYRWIVGPKSKAEIERIKGDEYSDEGYNLYVRDQNALHLLRIAQDESLKIIEGYERAKVTTDQGEIVRLIREYRLPFEAIPSTFLNAPEVWDALLDDMGFTAMLRNLGKMSAIKLLVRRSDAAKRIISRLEDAAQIKKARIHPIALLSALRVYSRGQGIKGSLTWETVEPINEALDAAFYLAFGNVESTNKRILLALDVSGSMDGGEIAGVPGLSPREAAGCLALVMLNTEPNCEVIGYTGAPGSNASWAMAQQQLPNSVRPLALDKSMRLDKACAYMQGLPMGATDCALPFLWAARENKEFEAVVSITDSETWCGKVHPSQAAKLYRSKIGAPTRLIVVGMTATNFSINDPQDPYGLDLAGFDAAMPNVLADFIKGAF